MFKWLPGGKDRLEGLLIGHFNEAIEAAVEETRPHIHVISGRLQKSLRQIPGKRDGRDYVSGMVAGGVRLRGVYTEQLKERDVDYGGIEEIRHPQMRAHFIPALRRRIMRRS
jgi:hypothetical protein